MNMLNQFVTQLAGFIGDDPNAIRVAWVVTIVLLLFTLWLFRWLLSWFFKTNEIVANQEHIIELLESQGQAMPVMAASRGMPQLAGPTMVPPSPIRQHPIDDEFSEILNVRPHNLSSQGQIRQVPTQPAPARPAPTLPAQPAPTLPAQPAPAQPAPTYSAPTQPAPTYSAPTYSAPSASAPVQPASVAPSPLRPVPNLQGQPTVMASTGTEPGTLMNETTMETVQAQPANTSVTMLGSPEKRAERQLEAREAMRLAEQAANATMSKTADIPDIPTALVRTYAATKTNPLTGKRVGDRAQSALGNDSRDAVPSQFQLHNRNP